MLRCYVSSGVSEIYQVLKEGVDGLFCVMYFIYLSKYMVYSTWYIVYGI